MPSTTVTSAFEGATSGILLVEEYGALAIAITAALKKFAPLHGVRVARTLAEAEGAAAEMRPELFVLDLDPPPSGDVDFFSKLQSRFPDARALVVAAGTSPEIGAERGTTGAVQFIEKPFNLGEFGAAVQALLGPWAAPPSHNFRGTLRDLHVVDIVQLKCLALSTAVVRLETTAGRVGEIHFQRGQISHASTGELSGVSAFEEIVAWPGGKLSEAEMQQAAPKTINQPWAVLLLQAVRKAAENGTLQTRDPRPTPALASKKGGKTILVVDDTEMLLVFAADVLETANSSFEVVTASSGREGLQMAAALRPDLILLDYSLTDISGAQVCRALLEDEATARIPVLMMSGHLPELANTAAEYGNVVATLPKPFLSGALINSVEKILATGSLPKAAVAPLVVAPPLLATPPSKSEPPPTPRVPPLKTILPNGHGHDNPKQAGPTEPAPVVAPSPAVSKSPRPAPPVTSASSVVPSAAVETSVSVAFSLEVGALQMTADFRLDSLQLRPAEALVGLRVGERGGAGPLVEAGFRIGRAELEPDGRLGTIRLFPALQSARLSPEGNSFTVAEVRSKPGEKGGGVELAGSRSDPMRVRLSASFTLLAVEFSPTFEIAAIVLRAREDRVQIGTGVDPTAASFEIMRAQLDATGRLSELFVRAIR